MVNLSVFKSPVSVSLAILLRLIFSQPIIATSPIVPLEVDEPIRCVLRLRLSTSDDPSTRSNLLPPSTTVNCDISAPSLINKVSLPVPNLI